MLKHKINARRPKKINFTLHAANMSKKKVAINDQEIKANNFCSWTRGFYWSFLFKSPKYDQLSPQDAQLHQGKNLHNL